MEVEVNDDIDEALGLAVEDKIDAIAGACSESESEDESSQAMN